MNYYAAKKLIMEREGKTFITLEFYSADHTYVKLSGRGRLKKKDKRK